VAADHAVLQSTLWTALFKSGTRVRSHRFQEEFAKRRIRSYPVGEVHKTVRKVHQAMIRRSGAERPSLQDLGLAVGRDAAAPGRPEGPIANLLPLATNAAIDEQLEGVMGLLYGTGRAVSSTSISCGNFTSSVLRRARTRFRCRRRNPISTRCYRALRGFQNCCARSASPSILSCRCRPTCRSIRTCASCRPT